VETLRENFKNLKIEYAPPRPHDFKGAIISIKKARQLLKWEPKISFKNGLREFISYIQGKKI
jgi:nucleoside-diphosphate-sugar epimerase